MYVRRSRPSLYAATPEQDGDRSSERSADDDDECAVCDDVASFAAQIGAADGVNLRRNAEGGRRLSDRAARTLDSRP